MANEKKKKDIYYIREWKELWKTVKEGMGQSVLGRKEGTFIDKMASKQEPRM